MSYNKIILIQFLIGIAICDYTYSRYYRYPQNDQINERAYRNKRPKVEHGLIIKDKVNITIYYETLCPASIDFFLSQLKPVVERLSSHLNVDLIPYGHARVREISTSYDPRGTYSFICQHGPAECNGNMLHACTLDAVKNYTEAILFNACLMQHRPYSGKGNHMIEFVPALNWCGHKQRVLIRGIWDCVHSVRGPNLLKKYGEVTNDLRPEYVPYLVLDGTVQEDAAGNLLSVVCQMLRPTPFECYN